MVGRAFATMCRLSVVVCNACIVTKRLVLLKEKKHLAVAREGR